MGPFCHSTVLTVMGSTSLDGETQGQALVSRELTKAWSECCVSLPLQVDQQHIAFKPGWTHGCSLERSRTSHY